MLSLKGWHPFAERSGAKGWFANRPAIPFGCAEKVATRRYCESRAGRPRYLDGKVFGGWLKNLDKYLP